MLLLAIPSLPPDLVPLQDALERSGVDVRLAVPPKAGVYGLYQPRARRLWVAPVTRPLGIFRRTFLHEAVHAAQSCPSGVPSVMGVVTQPSAVVARRIQLLLSSNYSPHHTAVEKEAFEIQGRSDAIPLLIQLLSKRCSAGSRQ